ncbi:hypothetical protein ACHAPC_008957 [Botrytis cinerea]|uniref:Uncharacterized protein n=1 Tax=Botryotinia fuckeliana (strain BcDW1) TaxID=1290391 RepID=M7ULI3_BOTF1|nr:hypothetical protein BcDW1_6887 [Botrytis cinerea BcDW1]
MPSQNTTTAADASQQKWIEKIYADAANDTRNQPWKAALPETNDVEEPGSSDESDEELVKTGGPLDILTHFLNV